MPVADCTAAASHQSKADRDAAQAKPLPVKNALIKLALMRWDELDELALYLSRMLSTAVVGEDELRNALLQMVDGKFRSLGEYCRFESDPRNYERFDSSRSALWIVTRIDGLEGNQETLPKPVVRRGELKVVEAAIGSIENVRVDGFEVVDSPYSEQKLLGAVALRKTNT
jgi:hypothetical protein